MISQTHYARYLFQTPQGQAYTGDFPQKRKQRYALGDTVEVFYNPQNPQQNCTMRRLEEDRHIHIMFRVLFGAMLVVGLGAVALFFCFNFLQ